MDVVRVAWRSAFAWRRSALFSGLLLVLHIVLALPLPLAMRGVAAQALLLLPGMLFGLLLTRNASDRLERGFAAVCCGIALSLPLLLALHALPGGLSWWRVLLPFDLLTLVMGWRLVFGPSRPGRARRATGDDRKNLQSSVVGRWSPETWEWLVIAFALVLGAAFRLPFLGRAEFQGDEANAMLLALSAVNGRGDILLWHTKGPAEVLLPLGSLALLGGTNEFIARLPFALAGEAVLLGVIVLARRLAEYPRRPTTDDRRPTAKSGGGRSSVVGRQTGTATGAIAACILALDGFLIAFSRIVQYQSIVALMSIGAVWCCWRFFAGVARPIWYIVTAAALLAVGLLAHYDAVFAMPVAAGLVIAGGWRHRWTAGQWLLGLGLPLLVGTALLASFYVPFALHERFQRTLTYLGSRVGQDEGGFRLFNKLSEYYLRATFYNTTFQIATYALVLLGAVAVWLHQFVRPRPLGWLIAAFMLLCCVPLARDSGSLDLANGNSWALAVFAVPLAALLLAPATPAALRMLLLWFAPPFLAETFLFVQPKTHFYTMHTAAALLLGFAVVQFAQWLGVRWRRVPRLALLGGAAALLALAVPYQYILFVRQSPEYRLVFPAARPAIYRAFYGDDLRWIQGFFGFPHRAGWKVIGDLYRTGVLHGTFASNEDFVMTHWYTRQASWCGSNPDYYLIALHPLEAKNKLPEQLQTDYSLLGDILVDGARQIEIYSRQPVQQPPRTFDLGDSLDSFDAEPLVRPPAQQTVIQLAPVPEANAEWQNGVSLRDADLGTTQLYAGQDTTFTLNWHADRALAVDYDVVMSVLDTAGNATQIGAACQALPATAWHTQDGVEASFSWVADPQLAPGNYRMKVQLRDPQTGQPLPLANGSDGLDVATLTVKPQ